MIVIFYRKRYKESKCGIYAIVNKVNNKMYVGRSVCIPSRWTAHQSKLRLNIHFNSHLQRAWNKYGEENFELIILEECKEEVLREREMHYIAFYKTQNEEFGYNYSAGGDGILHANEETRKKKSESAKKYIRENPEKAKIRMQHAIDAARRPEVLEKRRQNMLERYKNPEYLAKFRTMFQDEELKKKMTEINRAHAKPLSPEAADKLASYSRKPVICVETGEWFRSIADATRSLPGHVNIYGVLQGKKQTAGGYHWKYANK